MGQCGERARLEVMQQRITDEALPSITCQFQSLSLPRKAYGNDGPIGTAMPFEATTKFTYEAMSTDVLGVADTRPDTGYSSADRVQGERGVFNFNVEHVADERGCDAGSQYHWQSNELCSGSLTMSDSDLFRRRANKRLQIGRSHLQVIGEYQ
ncbi:unnamed protein product [Soboliphyme baturini]|uniref:CIA30 domain-containing protein n=1 Tax=Soboliphyme baturini TaxID=241478 RepID=A0A183IVP2_9BILA|nr:unnamed protein product [Soboliphyme baturini]